MLKASYAKDIFRLSAPNSLQQASGTIITTVKQGLLGGLGVAAIAGFSCAGKLSSLLMMPVYGFVQSIVFFIAQNTTAQQPDRVHTGLREGRRILFFYSLLVAALCIGLNGPLLRLFTTDAAAAAYGSTMLAFEGISYVFTAQKHLCEARLRGAQKMGLYLASNLGQIGLNLAACWCPASAFRASGCPPGSVPPSALRWPRCWQGSAQNNRANTKSTVLVLCFHL